MNHVKMAKLCRTLTENRQKMQWCPKKVPIEILRKLRILQIVNKSPGLKFDLDLRADVWNRSYGKAPIVCLKYDCYRVCKTHQNILGLYPSLQILCLTKRKLLKTLWIAHKCSNIFQTDYCVLISDLQVEVARNALNRSAPAIHPTK